MDPVTISAVVTSILHFLDWKKIGHDLAADEVKKQSKGLLGRLLPTDRDKAAQVSVELFVKEFLTELHDKTPFDAALPGYHDQLKLLVKHAAMQIASFMQPETKEVDLRDIESTWSEMKLDPLPEGFDWTLVAASYARDIRRYVKTTPNLRAMLDTALLEQQTEFQRQSAEALNRMCPLDPGFDLTGYRDFLRKKCALLQLSAMHTSTYDRRINLWSVFVPQSARESVPVRDIPRELLRRMRQEGHLTREHDEFEVERIREGYQTSPVNPVLNIIQRERLVVVLGDPGSGKTSLLKFLMMRWVESPSATAESGPLLPIWIDLKEYQHERIGLLEYFHSGCPAYGLDAKQVEKQLKAGTAALYLDGLDEIFDGPTRGSVIDEIIAFTSRYSQARIVATCRIIGYEPDRLRNAGFMHATLEDFDDTQISDFIFKWHAAAEDDMKVASHAPSAPPASTATQSLAIGTPPSPGPPPEAGPTSGASFSLPAGFSRPFPAPTGGVVETLTAPRVSVGIASNVQTPAAGFSRPRPAPSTESARLQRQLTRALLESRAVRELAGNPLLLTMMAILNRNQDLPRDRIELYREASRVLLHEWDASRFLPVDSFARQEKEELLRELAGIMQQGAGGLAGNLIDRTRLFTVFRAFLKDRGIPDYHDKAVSLVKQLTERNFILCFAGADRFSFVHRTFLEYFCASWFVFDQFHKQTLTIEQLKTDVFGRHSKDESWHETLRLIAGMIGEKQSEELTRHLIAQDGRRDKRANLVLAAGCLSEVRNRRAIQATVDELWRRFSEEAIRYELPYYYESWKSNRRRVRREKGGRADPAPLAFGPSALLVEIGICERYGLDRRSTALGVGALSGTISYHARAILLARIVKDVAYPLFDVSILPISA